MVKKIILAFIVWKLILFFFVFLATFILPFNKTFTTYSNPELLFQRFSYVKIPYFLRIWANFDGIHYIQIAERGYLTLEQPFFPLYPLLIRTTAKTFKLPYLISGQLISNVAFIISLFLISRILTLDKKRHLLPLLLTTIFLFPTSFFYGAVYNDSLFLLLATFTLYFGRKQKWLLGSIFAALATLTRLNGLALIFFLFLEYVLSNRETIKNPLKLFMTGLYFSILPLVSFIGYLLYVQKVFKDWNLVFTTMKIWGQDKIILPIQVFWRYIKIIFVYPTFALNYWVATIEFLSVLFIVFLIFYSFKKIRLSYWIFIIISILIPSFTGTFQGMPRYGLHLYPFFLALALFLENKPLLFKIILGVVSILIMFFSLSLFTRGYFIA